MYESSSEPPVTRSRFARRLARHVLAAVVVLVIALGIGMVGYGYFEGLSPTDGFLNSAMLLGGMGPVDLPKTEGGKLFAGFYALFAGLVFIATAGLVLTPVVHRVLHRFHWESDSDT